MLVSIKDLIGRAQRKKVALGAFNVYNLETTLAVVEAAEELQSPVIVQTTPKAIEYAGLEYLATLIKKVISSSSLPIVLHLDHGLSVELVEECIKAGYTSVMIDGSHLPLIENIALTKRVVEIAHKAKVSVEGELGTLSGELKLTDPKEVSQFVRETGVDSLAVAIGSSHGHAKNEVLNLELLEEIKRQTNIPLVLHGASGVSDADLKGAISRGICKINIDTLLREAFTEAVKEGIKARIVDPRIYLKRAKEAVKNVVKEKILLFGSMNV